ncbi:MAG: TetR/AcrR family transcriptional regulator [Planctomycetes bacterium]|nr:TetR/AcrR family transcriptional regulator [Planctomycetota bacterium]
MARPPKARLPIKQAALQLFVEHGVHATGIREIARAAGCSEAALYRHWPNKEGLVDALFREHLDDVTKRLDQAIASHEALADRVFAACQSCYRLYDEQPLVFRFVLLVQHELSKNLEPGMRGPQDVVVDLVRAAVKRGECRVDPPLAAAALIGVFLQTATFVLYGRLPGPLSRYADAVSATAMRILI